MILAIDPGNIKSAYVLWDGKTILDKNKIDNQLLLQIIKDKIYDIGLIEMISSYGMAVGQTTFDTCVWIGIFKNALSHYLNDKNIKLIFRQTIKMHHCKSTRASDSNIRQALINKYGEDSTIARPNLIYKTENKIGMSGDIWSAFAIATFWTEPKDNQIQNLLDREENKLTPNLL